MISVDIQNAQRTAGAYLVFIGRAQRRRRAERERRLIFHVRFGSEQFANNPIRGNNPDAVRMKWVLLLIRAVGGRAAPRDRPPASFTWSDFATYRAREGASYLVSRRNDTESCISGMVWGDRQILQRGSLVRLPKLVPSKDTSLNLQAKWDKLYGVVTEINDVTMNTKRDLEIRLILFMCRPFGESSFSRQTADGQLPMGDKSRKRTTLPIYPLCEEAVGSRFTRHRTRLSVNIGRLFAFRLKHRLSDPAPPPLLQLPGVLFFPSISQRNRTCRLWRAFVSAEPKKVLKRRPKGASERRRGPNSCFKAESASLIT
ncbi:hypothetical protein EVAR_28014_1 [Eumeta japonica]|uniref:Uncharacterized protein n=1 Tax=Eumeta variegata TaxID=151549 RepID=A0A4C1WB59_EUMVA|nr:hypothetical protein EVAR_28014_1 [Eumeta japonica]